MRNVMCVDNFGNCIRFEKCNMNFSKLIKTIDVHEPLTTIVISINHSECQVY